MAKRFADKKEIKEEHEELHGAIRNVYALVV